MEIYISPQKICTEFECGRRIRDFPLLVRHGRNLRYLSEEKVSEDIETVSFLRRRWYGWSKMVVSEEYLSATTFFLRMFHNNPNWDFDCYSFANLAADLPLHDTKWLHAFWDIKKINAHEVVGHRIIFLVNEQNGGFAHATLQLGNGHWLSVQGGGGTLSVSTLSDLQKAYADYPDLWEVTPKSEEEVQLSVELITQLEAQQC